MASTGSVCLFSSSTRSPYLYKCRSHELLRRRPYVTTSSKLPIARNTRQPSLGSKRIIENVTSLNKRSYKSNAIGIYHTVNHSNSYPTGDCNNSIAITNDFRTKLLPQEFNWRRNNGMKTDLKYQWDSHVKGMSPLFSGIGIKMESIHDNKDKVIVNSNCGNDNNNSFYSGKTRILRGDSSPPSPSILSTLQFYLGDLPDDKASESWRREHQRRSRNKYHHRNNVSFSQRLFTTKSTITNGTSDHTSHKNNDGSSGENAKTSIEQTTTDPEFADYLNGKIESDFNISKTSIHVQSLPDPIELNYINPDFDKSPPTPTPPSESAVSKNSKKLTGFEWFNTLLTDKSNELAHLDYTPAHQKSSSSKSTSPSQYQHIQRSQRNNQERTRAERVVTVRRALVGNLFITAIKLAAFLHSGSSAMKAEFVHSVVDCGNQSLLLLGLRDSGNKADRAHPYGYGKSIYFWALVSALGTFFLGAGISMTQSIPELLYGPSLHEITWHVWGVLGVSFAVDGYVFTKTILEVKESMPSDGSTTLWKHIYRLRDPAILAILLEDGAACLGVLMAFSGLALTHAFDMPVFDAVAGVGISGLLAAMGVILVRVNHRFLLGQAVDYNIIQGIEKILLDRISIDNVQSVQSQWTGPETFSYKAEVDFDGTFLAAKLMPRYQQEFAQARATLDQDLRVLLSWYAEDVMRTVEREVRDIEADIRKKYPGAQFIELEPMSKDSDRYAIDDGMEAQLKRIETEALNRYLKRLYQDRTPKA